MEEEKNVTSDISADAYDAADRPFDFVGEGGTTALICEGEPANRAKISSLLKGIGYQTTEAASGRDALKNMRFHVYDVIVVNEAFDRTGQELNPVLDYLENLAMVTRRQMFVALVSDTYRTLDNVAAFNRSVNITINTKSIDEVDKIIAQGKADNEAFYHVFNDSLRKTGKL